MNHCDLAKSLPAIKMVGKTPVSLRWSRALFYRMVYLQPHCANDRKRRDVDHTSLQGFRIRMTF
ncbi:hypothetical protein XH88_06480 [Bradyrhizobium sp. CCBAU 51627]|nr:hypothetical protein [Bradyrhizobium sp. CCBAU 51627]